jgi:hypothetical protein
MLHQSIGTHISSHALNDTSHFSTLSPRDVAQSIKSLTTNTTLQYLFVTVGTGTAAAGISEARAAESQGTIITRSAALQNQDQKQKASRRFAAPSRGKGRLDLFRIAFLFIHHDHFWQFFDFAIIRLLLYL